MKSTVAGSVVLGQEHDDPQAIFFSPHHPPSESDGDRCRPLPLHTISIVQGTAWANGGLTCNFGRALATMTVGDGVRRNRRQADDSYRDQVHEWWAA